MIVREVPLAFQASWLQRQLGIELMELRDRRHLSQAEAAHALAWSQAKVGRMERAENRIDPQDIARIGQLYELSDAEVERLSEMARANVTDTWWHRFRPWIAESYSTLISYENDAASALLIHPAIVPGLVQTRSYMAGLYGNSSLIRDADRVEAQIEVRALRQRRLFDPKPLKLEVVIPVHALTLPYGGREVQREQLEHLRELTDLPNIDVLVMTAADPAMATPLDVYELSGPDGPAVAVSEAMFAPIIHDDLFEVRQARRVVTYARDIALSSDDSKRVIEQALKGMG